MDEEAAEEPHGPSLDSPSTDCPSTLTTARGHIPLPAQHPSMEVTTVTPSPASPTEGDDLCETDVTSVAIHSVTLLICLCGLAGNGAVIGLLNLRIHNSDFFMLAVTDFLFLLFAVPSALLFLVEDVSCTPIMPLLYLSFLLQLSVVSLYWGLFWLTDRSAVWYMDKLCCRWGLPKHLWLVLNTVQSWDFFALFTVIPTMTFLCPSHQQEHCQAVFISMYILIFAGPTAISHTINFINSKQGSQQQQPKRRDIVVFVIVLVMFLFNLWNFLQQLGYIDVPSQVVFLLICIHSSSKPFICFLQGSAGDPAPWGRSSSPSRGSLRSQKKKTARRNDPAMDRGI